MTLDRVAFREAPMPGELPKEQSYTANRGERRYYFCRKDFARAPFQPPGRLASSKRMTPPTIKGRLPTRTPQGRHNRCVIVGISPRHDQQQAKSVERPAAYDSLSHLRTWRCKGGKPVEPDLTFVRQCRRRHVAVSQRQLHCALASDRPAFEDRDSGRNPDFAEKMAEGLGVYRQGENLEKKAAAAPIASRLLPSGIGEWQSSSWLEQLLRAAPARFAYPMGREVRAAALGAPALHLETRLSSGDVGVQTLELGAAIDRATPAS
jgi:hypothetical protein